MNKFLFYKSCWKNLRNLMSLSYSKKFNKYKTKKFSNLNNFMFFTVLHGSVPSGEYFGRQTHSKLGVRLKVSLLYAHHIEHGMCILRERESSPHAQSEKSPHMRSCGRTECS